MAMPQYHQDNAVSPLSPTVDGWEDWEDDDVVTPIDAGEQVLIQSSSPISAPSMRSPKSSISRSSNHSSVKIGRLKSRKRQQAQNAKAGIKLITDMTTLRRQNHIANQVRSPNRSRAKFRDTAALKALEGEPNSASVGNWNWLKKGKAAAVASPLSAISPIQQQRIRGHQQELSPQDRPIVIGIALPEAEGREISPQTATVYDLQTPGGLKSQPNRGLLALPSIPSQTSSPLNSSQPQSVWSPDTPDTASSFGPCRSVSSVYSQVTVPGAIRSEEPPPVPSVPLNYKSNQKQRILSLELRNKAADEDETGTPCTLFEEDGICSPLKSAGGKNSAVTPDSAGSRSQGWWDHVVTPFIDRRMSFSSRKPKNDLSNEKSENYILNNGQHSETRSQNLTPPQPIQPRTPVQPPIVRVPTPKRTPPPQTTIAARETPRVNSPRHTVSSQGIGLQEKPQIIITDESQPDHPPPYSPPKTRQQGNSPTRYRAVFPVGHPLHNQFSPSPRPASPGLAGTMTSQSASQTAAAPVTPPTRANSPLAYPALPTRALGTCVPESHNTAPRGAGYEVERRRRRHEKEEVVARRLGGFWRGRGCVPKNGCFGRTGAEGRKRRRVWLAVLAGFIVLTVLAVVLPVMLTRRHGSQDPPSIWVNLTDYPPMPTGVLTVVGPDNTEKKSGCTKPSTLWSCSLPKDDHESVAPYKANQPTVILQIQWDNGTKESWNVPNGDAPPQISGRALRQPPLASRELGERDTSSDFNPDPSPPKFKEMWFLGNTTDQIQSDKKAGEATPFYISLLRSTNATVEKKELVRRENVPNIENATHSNLIPPPDLNADGTSAPAVMLPEPVQQPVRLYDRGLPTEHYGFYTHFKRSIYLKSVTVINKTDENNIPLDEDGGCRRNEADFKTTWGETRLLVQIWTRKLNSSKLLRPGQDGHVKAFPELIRPGSMPYPVTVTLDTHGGDPNHKLVWDWPIDDRQHVDVDKANLLANEMGVGGTWINRRGKGDAKFGGFDGGTGGCKCEWVNWVGGD